MKKLFTKIMSVTLLLTLIIGVNTVSAQQAKVLSLAGTHQTSSAKVITDGTKDGWNLTWATTVTNLLGNTQSGNKVWGLYNRFTPTDLNTLGAVGMNITKIKCYPYSHSSYPTVMTGLSVSIYVGGSYTTAGGFVPGTQVVNQTVQWDNVYGEHEITLDNPVYIDGTQEVWIGVVYTFSYGYPATACDSNAYQPLKGDVMSYLDNSGNTVWCQTKSRISSNYFPYNWYVLGYLEPGTPTPGGDAIIDADFEIGKNGDKIAQTYINAGYSFFTTWSQTPGSAEDPVFTTEQVAEGSLAAKLTYGNDFVTLLDDRKTGHYNVNFDMYVPAGKDAYFNILHVFSGSNSEWATEIYFNHSDGTYAKINGVNHNFTFPFKTWFPVDIDIDLDNDLATLTINAVQVAQWQFSLNADASKGGLGTRQLAGMDFFPPTSAAVSQYYIDNYVFTDLNAGGSVIFSTDFEDAKAGAHLASSYPDYWTTWSSQPGGTEDGVISTEQAASGTQSAKLAYGNDNVFLAGDKTTGEYTVNFNMYVPDGKDAYFNILHVFAGTNSEWAIEVYFNSTDGTYVKINGVNHNFTFPLKTWFPVAIDINLDSDLASLTVNGVQVAEWQFSLDADASKGVLGTRQFAAMDFFPPTSTAKSLFYIDDFELASKGGSTAPNMSVDVDKINLTLKPGASDSKEVTVSNTGTSIGDYTSWVAYDNIVKGDNSIYTLKYCGDAASGVGYTNSTPVIEVGARFPFDYYSTFLGTELTQISYYAYAAVGNNTMTFRVYGQGSATEPGELLATKVLNAPILNYWNTVTLDTPVPLNGQDIWITVEFKQAEVSTYPISVDNKTDQYNVNGDFVRRDGGIWSTFGGQYGNVCIYGLADGTPLSAWVYLSGTIEASLKAGESKTFNVMFDATGLTNGTKYTATLHINTNDTNHPSFTIPITLNCYDGFENINSDDFSMYPNPTSDNVNIKSKSMIHNVIVYNEVGQTVYQTSTNNMSVVISLSSFKSGIYFVRIDTENGINISKLIVK